MVRFHATGAVALESGKVREALAIFRKLDANIRARHYTHARSREAVLVAGLGQVARDEAKRALVADPKSADGERVLGWTLEHDLIGRRFRSAPTSPAPSRPIAGHRARSQGPLCPNVARDPAGPRTPPDSGAIRRRLADNREAVRRSREGGDSALRAGSRRSSCSTSSATRLVIERTQAARNQDTELLAAWRRPAAGAGGDAHGVHRLRRRPATRRVPAARGAELLLLPLPRTAALYDEGRAPITRAGAAPAPVRRAHPPRPPPRDRQAGRAQARRRRARVLIQMFEAAADDRLPAKTASARLATADFTEDLVGARWCRRPAP